MNFDVSFYDKPMRMCVNLEDAVLINGKDGKSAYEVAVANGFDGTEAEWLESLHGEDGVDGKDGAPGRDGQDGQPGRDGIDGKDYILTEADKAELVEEVLEQIPEQPSGGGVTAEEVDEKIAEAIEAIPNPSWNDLTDKPFGEGAVTDWKEIANGSIRDTGSIKGFSVEPNQQFTLTPQKTYKVVVYSSMVGTREVIGVASKESRPALHYDFYSIGSAGDAVQLSAQTGIDAMISVFSITLAEPIQSFMGVSVTIYEEKRESKPLDEKYIPDSIARAADIPAVPTKLSELENDSGFLTADDIPEGGGSVSWNDITDKPFGEMPVFDIEWDGNMDGKFVLDMSMLGYEKGLYYVKVSDIVPIEEDLVGSIGHRITLDGYTSDFQVTPDIIDTASFPGAYNIGGRIVVVHNQNLLNSAIGAPDGYVTNGTYFLLREGKDYVSRFTSGAKITKLDEKSIPTAVPVIQTAQMGQTIVVKAVDENGKPTEWEAADLPEGGGSAIIDVTELPTEDINEDVFYRVVSGSLLFGRFVLNAFTVYCVNELPEVGEPAVNEDMTQGVFYYNVQDGSLNCYLDANLSAALSAPEGWCPADTFLSVLGYGYSGVITDIMDDPEDGNVRLLLEYVIWQYKNEKWTSLKSIGWAGNGGGAVLLNSALNKAGGEESIAEGYNTIASGSTQHVQGRSNIEDATGKYAHIVGNGAFDAKGNLVRSNAHTLDWSGLGWFAGGLKVGGTGQDDEASRTVMVNGDTQIVLTSPGGKKFAITVSDDGVLTATAQ